MARTVRRALPLTLGVLLAACAAPSADPTSAASDDGAARGAADAATRRPSAPGYTIGPDGAEYAPGGRRIPDDAPPDRRGRLAINPTRGVTISAISDDGLAWTREPGVRLALDHELSDKMATAPAALTLPDGRVRIYHGGVDLTLGDARLLSAVSEDGLTFVREPGIRFRNDSGYATDPAVVAVDGAVVLFFVSCGDEFSNRFLHGFVQRTESVDGLAFGSAADVLRAPDDSFESPELFRAGDRWLLVTNGLQLFTADDLAGPWSAVEDAGLPLGGGASVVPLDEGYRMYFTQHHEQRHRIASARSADGVHWVEESGIRLAVDDASFGLLNPDVHRLPDGRWRMYLNYMWDSERLDGP